jgi:hypothetical protein
MAAGWIVERARVKAGTLRQHDHREPGPRMLEFVGRTFTNAARYSWSQSASNFMVHSPIEFDGGGHLTLYAATFEDVDNFILG